LAIFGRFHNTRNSQEIGLQVSYFYVSTTQVLSYLTLFGRFHAAISNKIENQKQKKQRRARWMRNGEGAASSRQFSAPRQMVQAAAAAASTAEEVQAAAAAAIAAAPPPKKRVARTKETREQAKRDTADRREADKVRVAENKATKTRRKEAKAADKAESAREADEERSAARFAARALLDAEDVDDEDVGELEAALKAVPLYFQDTLLELMDDFLKSDKELGDIQELVDELKDLGVIVDHMKKYPLK
jgi:flagellar biosynthesis GTPase FlhF